VTSGTRLVVGTSAGVDSTVLFRAICALGHDAVAVYVDHGLRPESADEAAFVQALAASLGAESLVVSAPVAAGNQQNAARRARYAALAEAARQVGAGAVAVGHTATDQAETVLMALVRGAGLRGLAGMAPRRPLDATVPDGLALVRPLLWATRAEVEDHARSNGWTWRDDPSNATDWYRRNRIRHGVLPLLEAEGGPRTAARIAQASMAARSALDASPLADFNRIAIRDPRGLSLPLGALQALTPDACGAVLAEALRTAAPDAARSQAVVARLIALVSAPAGRRVGLDGVAVWRDRDRLRFVAGAPPMGPVRVGPDGADTAAGRLARRPADSDSPAWTAALDLSVLDAPLTLRPWRPGDRLDVDHRDRRVSDLLTDARVPPSERSDALVLDAGPRVAALIGHAVADWAAPRDAAAAVRFGWVPAGSVVPPTRGR
jgi:tRNA(Ile)-lysidine synthase